MQVDEPVRPTGFDKLPQGRRKHSPGHKFPTGHREVSVQVMQQLGLTRQMPRPRIQPGDVCPWDNNEPSLFDRPVPNLFGSPCPRRFVAMNATGHQHHRSVHTAVPTIKRRFPLRALGQHSAGYRLRSKGLKAKTNPQNNDQNEAVHGEIRFSRCKQIRWRSAGRDKNRPTRRLLPSLG